MGIWKALDEMEELGWIGSERPRMVCVQAEGCAPLVARMRRVRSSQSRFRIPKRWLLVCAFRRRLAIFWCSVRFGRAVERPLHRDGSDARRLRVVRDAKVDRRGFNFERVVLLAGTVGYAAGGDGVGVGHVHG